MYRERQLPRGGRPPDAAAVREGRPLGQGGAQAATSYLFFTITTTASCLPPIETFKGTAHKITPRQKYFAYKRNVFQFSYIRSTLVSTFIDIFLLGYFSRLLVIMKNKYIQ
jgi:hypothetical protein